MSRPVISINSKTPLSKIQEILVKEDIGRLPVLDDEKQLIGLVSRHEVLRTLYGDADDFTIPEWAHTIKGGVSTNSIGGEAALDFMFLPRPKRRLGWYLEPSYGYDFSSGHQQSMSLAAGLLIAIR